MGDELVFAVILHSLQQSFSKTLSRSSHGEGDSLTRQIEPRHARATIELMGDDCGRLLELRLLLLWEISEVWLTEVYVSMVISVANDGGQAALGTGPTKVNGCLLICWGVAKSHFMTERYGLQCAFSA